MRRGHISRGKSCCSSAELPTTRRKQKAWTHRPVEVGGDSSTSGGGRGLIDQWRRAGSHRPVEGRGTHRPVEGGGDSSTSGGGRGLIGQWRGAGTHRPVTAPERVPIYAVNKTRATLDRPQLDLPASSAPVQRRLPGQQGLASHTTWIHTAPPI